MDDPQGATTFRRMRREDLPLLAEWLHRPHVRRWWEPGETLAEIEAHYMPRLEGEEPVDLYLALAGGRPFAFLQTYLADNETAGIDLFLAEEAETGRGIGSALIRLFVDEVVFARPGTQACIADPEAANGASIRAFEKAGFEPVRTFTEDGKSHVLVRKERSRHAGGS